MPHSAHAVPSAIPDAAILLRVQIALVAASMIQCLSRGVHLLDLITCISGSHERRQVLFGVGLSPLILVIKGYQSLAICCSTFRRYAR